MGASEKIYLEKVYPDNGVLPNGINYYQSPNDIEYIRTDAFIEKAKKWMNNNICRYDSESIYDREELVRDFENFMKGE